MQPLPILSSWKRRLLAALLLFVRRCPAHRAGLDCRESREGKRPGRRGFALWSRAPLGSLRTQEALGTRRRVLPAAGNWPGRKGGRRRALAGPPGLSLGCSPGAGSGAGLGKLSLSGGGLGSARQRPPPRGP
ncbi:unnamed protein product [Rangifer tarandus platyrhynchus]|uniref:Uncharacterized protein n=2 Tax=Rangifer tarandus platyrhynchus TaxID=3082113 RepID=A0ABN8ZJW8_RANTA|nr:unnamed protein product [Rangifer tarandus platyrhynchus]CAI9707375.1 unnamed protein product [Rangifer tarandus platyrhynchus]